MRLHCGYDIIIQSRVSSLAKVDFWDHPAVFSIESIGTVARVAALVLAALVLWGVKIDMSTPDCVSISFIHREMVSFDTGL